MAESHGFERIWQERLSRSLDVAAGESIRGQVFQAAGDPPDERDPHAVAAWTRRALEQLSALAPERVCRAVMTGCACFYPHEQLFNARQAYRAGGVRAAHQVLWVQFKAFLRNELALEENLVDEILRRGWGLAGAWDGDHLVATKIPKSGSLKAYFSEPDPAKRRLLYCHCPRVRPVIALGEELPIHYCYCGAGFYQDIWQTITGESVEVELLESVLAGGDVCRIAISLPEPV